MSAVQELMKLKSSVQNKRKYQKAKVRLAEKYQNDKEKCQLKKK
jgi:hypothetical protein